MHFFFIRVMLHASKWNRIFRIFRIVILGWFAGYFKPFQRWSKLSHLMKNYKTIGLMFTHKSVTIRLIELFDFMLTYGVCTTGIQCIGQTLFVHLCISVFSILALSNPLHSNLFFILNIKQRKSGRKEL